VITNIEIVVAIFSAF